MEFTSIDIRMTLTNTKVMTSSGTIILYVKHGTVIININKSVNYFKQEYQVSLNYDILTLNNLPQFTVTMFALN